MGGYPVRAEPLRAEDALKIPRFCLTFQIIYAHQPLEALDQVLNHDSLAQKGRNLPLRHTLPHRN